MQRKIKFLLLISLSFILAACGSKPYVSNFSSYQKQSVNGLYKKATLYLNSKKYQSAINNFEAITALHPSSPYAEKAQIGIVEAYYKNADYDSTIAAADRYLHLYPIGQNTAYAYYLKGLANFYTHTSWLSKMYKKDPSERDLRSYDQAFVVFQELLQNYPNSKYAADARRKIIYIRDITAKHQLDIAKFYMRKKACVAAINRANYIINNLPNTKEVTDARYIVNKCKTQLKLK
ncbi:MAG: outer membrane protein assembly factor BamD [Gammaproteobacteria bacterium]|nr:outer membrane protein assembly factor BamD [Gammaproteobacteria bacterium]